MKWSCGEIKLTKPPAGKRSQFSRLAIFVSTRRLLGVFFCLIIWANLVRAEIAWDGYSNEQIVEAIGKAENSIKYPYGIKSIDTKGNKEYARRICLNSVRNGRARWVKADRPEDLIVYISLRYCPPTAHRLNSNWVKNVKGFLTKEK